MPARPISAILLVAALFALGPSCAAPRPVRFRVGAAESAVIPGLDACDDFGERVVEVDGGEPVTVLVHGCFSSSGRFRTLADVFRAHGQQTLCFSYDDRDSLDVASAELVRSLRGLAATGYRQQVTVIGHSQGGLVSRRAVTGARTDGLSVPAEPPLRLVTVSSPFNGIRASSHCGLLPLHILSFGITFGVCQAITGDKWSEIPPGSAFMARPGALLPAVRRHLKVVTDERETCRRTSPTGECLEDDYVFSLDEQYNPAVDSDPRVENVEIHAGHAAIVGRPGRPPRDLIRVLQEGGIMRDTPPERREELDGLLARLY